MRLLFGVGHYTFVTFLLRSVPCLSCFGNSYYFLSRVSAVPGNPSSQQLPRCSTLSVNQDTCGLGPRSITWCEPTQRFQPS